MAVVTLELTREQAESLLQVLETAASDNLDAMNDEPTDSGSAKMFEADWIAAETAANLVRAALDVATDVMEP